MIKICAVYGPNAVSIRVEQIWFKRLEIWVWKKVHGEEWRIDEEAAKIVWCVDASYLKLWACSIRFPSVSVIAELFRQHKANLKSTLSTLCQIF